MSGITKGRVIGLLSVIVLSLSGCGASYDSKSLNQETIAMEAMPQGEVAPEAIAEESGAETSANQEQIAQINRKLIRTISMGVETNQYNKLMQTLEEDILKLGGYIENLNEWNESSYAVYPEQTVDCKNATIVARIPKEQSTAFVKTVEEQSNVIRRSESVEDVTLQYVDVESHKKMLQTEQESLLRLLETAEKIEDIIAIEGRLSEVRYQIESMESTLRTYDNLVDYDTVTIDIREVVIYTQQPQLTAVEKITTGLQTNCYKIVKGLKSFGIWFVITIPYFVLWGIIISIVLILVRAIRKGRQKRMFKKQIQTHMQIPIQNLVEKELESETESKQEDIK